jgi:hypothetical protein
VRTDSTGQKANHDAEVPDGREDSSRDRVTYGGNAGVIELVAEGLTGISEEDWLFETNGAGIMVAESKVFGRVYLPDPHEEEDLRFVSRAE